MPNSRRITMAVLIALFLSFLFYQTRGVDVKLHNITLESLRQLKHLDTLIDEDVLKLRYQLLQNYDSLVNNWRKIHQYSENLRFHLDFVMQVDFSFRYDSYLEMIKEKEALCESFKSQNSFLNNSIGYLQITSRYFLKRDSSSVSFEEINELLYLVLSYHFTLDDDLRSKIQQKIQSIQKQEKQISENALQELENIYTHSRVILEEEKKLNLLLKKIVAFPITGKLDELLYVYEAKHNYHAQQVDNYLVIFYLLLLILIAYVVYILIRLQKNAIALCQAKENLEERVRIRTRELEESNTDLARARDKALMASQVKDQFLANMSHELRTPLHAIIGLSEILTEIMNEKGYDEEIEDVKSIHSSGIHLLDLINDLLDISKIESGNMKLSTEEFIVEDLIYQIVQTINPLLKKNHNDLHLKVENKLGIMLSDATRIRQCLLNLLSNATKFTKNGEIHFSVKRERNGEQELIIFEVKDNGIGIPSEKVPKLFTSFYQIDSSHSRKYEGTGLGLAITQKLCYILGGEKIQVQSELEHGSTFTMALPTELKEKNYRLQLSDF